MLCITSSLASAESTSKEWCKNSSRDQIAPPNIDITTVERIGNALVTKYRIKGSVEGVCLSNAAVFENGKQVKNLRSQLKRDFTRFEFTTIADVRKNPEIRAYTIHGDRAVAQIRPNSTTSSNKDYGTNLNDVEIIISHPYILTVPTPIMIPGKGTKIK